MEELSLWDDPNDKPTQLKVICFKESLEPPSALPITSERPPEKQIVGYAAQSFNQPEIPGVMSGWVSVNNNQNSLSYNFLFMTTCFLPCVDIWIRRVASWCNQRR